jgi:hypothetical protein
MLRELGRTGVAAIVPMAKPATFRSPRRVNRDSPFFLSMYGPPDQRMYANIVKEASGVEVNSRTTQL